MGSRFSLLGSGVFSGILNYSVIFLLLLAPNSDNGVIG